MAPEDHFLKSHEVKQMVDAANAKANRPEFTWTWGVNEVVFFIMGALFGVTLVVMGAMLDSFIQSLK